jgi:hypothetical protein
VVLKAGDPSDNYPHHACAAIATVAMLADSVIIIRRIGRDYITEVPIDGSRSQAYTAFDRCQQSATESPFQLGGSWPPLSSHAEIRL